MFLKGAILNDNIIKSPHSFRNGCQCNVAESLSLPGYRYTERTVQSFQIKINCILKFEVKRTKLRSIVIKYNKTKIYICVTMNM